MFQPQTLFVLWFLKVFRFPQFVLLSLTQTPKNRSFFFLGGGGGGEIWPSQKPTSRVCWFLRGTMPKSKRKLRENQKKQKRLRNQSKKTTFGAETKLFSPRDVFCVVFSETPIIFRVSDRGCLAIELSHVKCASVPFGVRRCLQARNTSNKPGFPESNAEKNITPNHAELTFVVQWPRLTRPPQKKFILQPFETWPFFHQSKGEPPLTSCNVQVDNASGSRLMVSFFQTGALRQVLGLPRVQQRGAGAPSSVLGWFEPLVFVGARWETLSQTSPNHQIQTTNWKEPDKNAVLSVRFFCSAVFWFYSETCFGIYCKVWEENRSLARVHTVKPHCLLWAAMAEELPSKAQNFGPLGLEAALNRGSQVGIRDHQAYGRIPPHSPAPSASPACLSDLAKGGLARRSFWALRKSRPLLLLLLLGSEKWSDPSKASSWWFCGDSRLPYRFRSQVFH